MSLKKDCEWQASKMSPKKFTHQTSLSKLILSFLIRLIFLTCIFITTWQAWNCVVKFGENPQSTSSSMEFIGNLPLPGITICTQLFGATNHMENVPYNETKLAECGLRFEMQIFDIL